MRLVLDIVEYCMTHVPRWNTLNIAGYHFREAGANAIQEMAFTLADAIAYIEQAQSRGLDVDSFAPRLSYSLGCYMDLFEEIAKYRAARRLFAKIMKTRFQAKNPKSYLFRIFSGSCGSTLVAQQPINNIVRVAMHALMGILGGHQAIHTACWDEGFALPSEDSARLALRTQQVLAHECGLCNTIDPLAGSFFVESLTNEIETHAAEYIQKIDDLGGMLAAIESGYVQREIQEASVAFQRRVDSGERVIVGLNAFRQEEENETATEELFEVDASVETIQCEKLASLRKRRDPENYQRAMDTLEQAVNDKENLMPYMLDAVRAYATVGEICNLLRRQWGEYKAPIYI
jgi:methylmalonyl-CoA mutase N-terminal domain/subunit